ncbi:hypothetical protein [Methylocaldum sp. 14B]|jgi:hypothetical protein|uniref:hypothetical protein n=1 Tax=Methylocaldum sp. 14B TaxID=1912213 RepID=UPI001180BF90|nr:hypothetical protein [Methylocaldum sp. 14B]
MVFSVADAHICSTCPVFAYRIDIREGGSRSGYRPVYWHMAGALGRPPDCWAIPRFVVAAAINAAPGLKRRCCFVFVHLLGGKSETAASRSGIVVDLGK